MFYTIMLMAGKEAIEGKRVVLAPSKIFTAWDMIELIEVIFPESKFHFKIVYIGNFRGLQITVIK